MTSLSDDLLTLDSLGNFGIGILSLGLITFTSFTFYSQPEDELSVWNYSTTPKGFLIEKAKAGFLHCTILVVPLILLLCVVFASQVVIILGLVFLIYIYLLLVVLSKYAAFPHELGIPQGIVVSLTFIFPPLLLIALPYFYSEAVKSLNHLLNDSD